MNNILIAALALFLAACASPAPGESMNDQIDALFADYSDGATPGYAVGVIREGDLIFAKGYGFADIEKKTPITADTAFNLASLSKQFTAAAIALELENGGLEIDDPLAQHWPALPAFMSEITIAHLIYMTSGLKEYYTLPSPKGGWASEDVFTVDDAIDAVFASGDLDYAPGSRWAYSNINYQLLAVLAAKLNDQSFADYMQTEIFTPLKMTSSWVDAPIDEARTNRATSYIRNEEDTTWQAAPRLSPHYGGSGVFSTLNDLATWDTALYGDQPFGAGFKTQMLSTRQFDHDKTNDAFGLVHGTYRDFKTIWYEGGDYGVSTYMVRLPERDETVICLSNIGDGGCADKAKAVIDLLIEAHRRQNECAKPPRPKGARRFVLKLKFIALALAARCAFKADDGRKRRERDALILISSPVRGLRPLRAGRLEIVNVPKVPIWYLPSFFDRFRPASISPKTSSTTRLASALLMSPASATLAMKSALLIDPVPLVSGAALVAALLAAPVAA